MPPIKATDGSGRRTLHFGDACPAGGMTESLTNPTANPDSPPTEARHAPAISLPELASALASLHCAGRMRRPAPRRGPACHQSIGFPAEHPPGPVDPTAALRGGKQADLRLHPPVRCPGGLWRPAGTGRGSAADAGPAVLRHPCRREHTAPAARRGRGSTAWRARARAAGRLPQHGRECAGHAPGLCAGHRDAHVQPSGGRAQLGAGPCLYPADGFPAGPAAHAQQAVHRRQRHGRDRRAQSGRCVFRCGQRQQFRGPRRAGCRAGGRRSVAQLRQLLEQPARLSRPVADQPQGTQAVARALCGR